MTLTYGSLFSGVGGLEMGIQSVLGGHTVWHSEIEPAPAKILARHWPDVPNLGDITAVDWATVAPIDVLTGGFPCQDVSLAGRRAGLIRDGEGRTRSGLWGHMLTAITELRPRLVVAENVRGLLSARADSSVEPCAWCLGDGDDEPHMRALGAVLADLAAVGYDATWVGLRAADVGAPHGRFRVFIFATPQDADFPVGGEWGTAASRQTEGWRTRANPRGRGNTPWGDYADAVHRWETTLGRPAPDPTEPSPRGGRRLSPRFVEWMMGYPDGHVVDTPRVNRNEALKACGNGVVPQQAAEAARRWMAYQAMAVAA